MLALLNGGLAPGRDVKAITDRHSLMLALLNGGSSARPRQLCRRTGTL